MKTKFILSIALSVLIIGCNNSSGSKEEIRKRVEITTDEIDENHLHNENETIVLDNGKKWKVAPEMLQFIRNMELSINDFSVKENPTTKDYQQLAELIDSNIRSLTSNCTMQGKAHDELHKWLLPFISLSEDFDVALGIEEQKRIYKEFKNAFIEFNVYFE